MPLPSSKPPVIEHCAVALVKISLVNGESRKKIWRNYYYSTIRFQFMMKKVGWGELGASEHQVILRNIGGQWHWETLLKAPMY